ncbi:Thoeris anti-defense Tad2 family protein [Pantoea anthophila]|uniref:Thoeris anti-defense Tad2 family protein n=1 Tax=Pantoea anthophila TaxID=470931 RepID=UPI000614C402|nr:MW1434 family type I TA system toxin [Pantoea anthophila]KKB02664.1 hypothetical protein TN98_20655 [Pantoea anthophila]
MMTAQQLNATISLIADAEADYAGDYMALLDTISRLGYTITDTSKTTNAGYAAIISKSGLTMTGYGKTLNYAACAALIKLHDLILRNEAMIDAGELNFRQEHAPLAVAQLWLSEGCKVARAAWGKGVYLHLTRGLTRAALNGSDMYGVPARYFDCSQDVAVTQMPQLLLIDTEKQTISDWAPASIDLLATDWRLI